jgi:TP901 family phage tail tape measure protein
MAGEKIIGFILRATDKTKQGLASASGSIRQFTQRVARSSGGLGGFMGKALTGGLRMFGGMLGGIAGLARRAFRGMAVGVAGVSAGLVMAMRRAQEFNKQIAQVATLTDINVNDAKKQVRGLAAEFGLAKEELTKGLYDAISAGIPKENAFEFLRTAAKTAIAGATDTASAVDLLTTTINAFGLEASKAEQTADVLFSAVRLGKTTIGELAASMAQAAPLASASGISLEEVAAAAASLTKQGVPTAMAMTQIRAAIIAMNRRLEDGWSSTMTLQEGMKKMSAMAGGSARELTRLTGRVEGANAILAMTGRNADSAADDLRQVRNAAGEMGNALSKVETEISLDKLFAAIDNIVRVAGSAALKLLGPTIELAAGKIAEFAETLAGIEENPKLKAIRDQIAGITDALFAGGDEAKKALSFMGDMTKAVFLDAASEMYNFLAPKLIELGKMMGKATLDAAKGRTGDTAIRLLGRSSNLGMRNEAAEAWVRSRELVRESQVGSVDQLATDRAASLMRRREAYGTMGAGLSGRRADEERAARAAAYTQYTQGLIEDAKTRRAGGMAGLGSTEEVVSIAKKASEAIAHARPQSSYGFLEHASAMGTEVREWRGEDIAKQQLDVMKQIADNTKGIGDSGIAID